MKKPCEKVVPLFRGVADGEKLFVRANRLDADRATWELACELYREATRLSPRHVEAWNNFGCMLYQLERHDEAMGAWRSALEVDPRHAEAQNNVGHALQQLGKLEAAAVYLLRAVESEPEMEEARFNLALCLQGLGRPRAALKHWREYLRRWPRSEYAPRAQQHVELCQQAATA